MAYSFTLHEPDLLWVVLHDPMDVGHAERYYREVWTALDSCPRPTGMLIDGRRLTQASHAARQRADQVAHHPHLGHVAFVVNAQHLLVFSPLVKMISGVGLFGDEHAALAYLHDMRGRQVRIPLMPPPTAHAAPRAPSNSNPFNLVADLIQGWGRPSDKR